MPIARSAVEQGVAQLNATRRPDEQIALESFEEPGRFVLSFPDRALGEGQCIDQDFSEIQFLLHDSVGVDTGIQGGRLDEDERRYHMTYEVIEWT